MLKSSISMKYHTKQTIQMYLAHARRYPWLCFFVFLLSSLATVGSMMTPLYYKRFFDILSGALKVDDPSEALLRTLLIIVALLVSVRLVFRRLAQVTDASLETRTQQDLANTAFAYLHKHSFGFFNDRFVGSLVKQVNYFTRAFEVIKDRIIWNLLPMAIEVGIAIAILSARDIRLGLLIGAWLVLFLSVNTVLTRFKLRYDVERSSAETAATGVLADGITNHANVKLFSAYSRERQRFGDAIGLVRRLRKFIYNLEILFDGIQGFLTTVLEVGILYVSVHLWRAGILTPGDFVLIQLYLFKIFDRVWDFGRIIRDTYQSFADAEDMTEILTLPHEITDAPGAKPLVVSSGVIELQRVLFNYRETRTVLSDFSLRILPKQKVALVGPSGAGKSTIVKLLLRQHDVTKGSIVIDGQSIRHVTQESLWDAIGFVPQDPILFHRTLKENIRYGKPDATDEEVIAAAKLAHCHEFIAEFPEAYDTYVGERGVKLSGGERQRVAIARAILRNAPILILDEATSSLDSESEQLIQAALAELMKGKTVIVIAHRLSTIMKMDRIVVIEAGKIVEDGTHAELLRKNDGIYKKLWQIQAGGFIA